MWKRLQVYNFEHLPPAVTRLANHVITIEELLETCKKERIGKIITIIKQ